MSTHVKYNAHRSRFRDESLSRVVDATDDLTGEPTLIAAQGAKYQVFVQRIEVNVDTPAAQIWTFSASGGAVLATLDSPSVGGRVLLLHAEEGVALPIGEDLEVAADGAGIGGSIAITAFQRIAPGAVLTPDQL